MMATAENGSVAANGPPSEAPNQQELHSPGSTPVHVQQVKHRPTFSEEQVATLERVFEQKTYLSSAERTQLANSINLSAQQVRVWFQNRRQKVKAYTSLRHQGKSPGMWMLYLLVCGTVISIGVYTLGAPCHVPLTTILSRVACVLFIN